MDIPTYITNHDAVVNFYGYWPSFHDANVPEYRAPTFENPLLEFTLHTRQMTNEVDSKGYFVLKKHALVKFYFDCLADVQMDEFGANNILFDVSFMKIDIDTEFFVELNSVMAMPGSFNARKGAVVSVIPCTATSVAL